MIYIRSFFANVVFYIVLIACCLVAPISFILPKSVILQIIRFQSIHTRISLKLFANLEVEYRGLKNIPKDRKYLIAAKHQSLAEAIFLNHAIDEPTIIAKKQLLFIPATKARIADWRLHQFEWCESVQRRPAEGKRHPLPVQSVEPLPAKYNGSLSCASHKCNQ